MTTNSNKKERIPSHVREEVWRLYGAPVCWCCQKEPISSQNKHFGHILAEKNGGRPTVENLRPVCASCNLRMRTKNMYDYMQERGYPLRDAASIYRLVKKDPNLLDDLKGRHVYAVPSENGEYDHMMLFKLLETYPFLKDININTLFAQSVYAQVKFHYILRPDYVRWFRHQLEKPYMDKLSSKLKGSCTLVYSSNVGENRSK